MSDPTPDPVQAQRRQFLRSLGAFAVIGGSSMLTACNSEDTVSSTTDDTSDATPGASGSEVVAGECVLIPEETAGPYPLLAILSNTAMQRADITEGKTGVPLTVKLKMQDYSSDCQPVEGIWVYLWHCDKDGVYSGYSQPGANTVGQTFLRGVQSSDSEGYVTFSTVYPGWYAGRITHIHFQVFVQSVNGSAVATSQFAFPAEVTTAVYNSSLYAAKGQNSSVTSFSQDNVFNDSTEYQLATVTGDVNTGYIAELVVNIPV